MKLNSHSRYVSPVCCYGSPTCDCVSPVCCYGSPTCDCVSPVCRYGNPTCDCVSPVYCCVDPTCCYGNPVCRYESPTCRYVNPLCCCVSPICHYVSPVYRCVSPACRYVSLRVQKLTARDRWLSVTRRSSKVFVYALTACDWELAAPPYFLAVFIFGSVGLRYLATMQWRFCLWCGLPIVGCGENICSLTSPLNYRKTNVLPIPPYRQHILPGG
jgi:hypothetical protein